MTKKKLAAWRSGRSRVDVVKTVTFDERHRAEGRNHGLPSSGEVTFLNDGRCPCKNECGHEFMWECEEADCKCCTSVCN